MKFNYIFLIILGLILLYHFCSNTVTEKFGPNVGDADISAIRNLNGLANTLMQPNGTLTNPGNLSLRGNLSLYNSDPNRGIGMFYNDMDGSSTTTYQGGLSSWDGIGLKCTLDGKTRHMFGTRTGNYTTTGNINVLGTSINNDGSASFANSKLTIDSNGNMNATGNISAANIGYTDHGGKDGMYMLPGNFMVQFGHKSHDADAWTRVTFRKPFSRVLGIQITCDGSGSPNKHYLQANSLTNNGATFDSSWGSNSKSPIYWIAYGLA